MKILPQSLVVPGILPNLLGHILVVIHCQDHPQHHQDFLVHIHLIAARKGKSISFGKMSYWLLYTYLLLISHQVYTIVTQTQVNVDNTCCNPTAVSNLLAKNLGFEVIMLDNKCYPLLHNEATTTLEFWKSTRKILAASKTSYERLTGKPFNATIDLTKNDDPPRPVKRKYGNDVNEKLNTIIAAQSLQSLQFNKFEKAFNFINTCAKIFDCVVCISTCRKPIVADCCQRVVGCEACVQQWGENNNTCPHCSSELLHPMSLKGIDELLLIASMLEGESTPPAQVQARELDEDSDSDFEPPPMRFRRPN